MLNSTKNLKRIQGNETLIQLYRYIIVGSRIVAHTLIETGNGPNKPNTINL